MASAGRAVADGPEMKGDRVAKLIARAGLASRREAETMIAAGRVALNGRTLTTPAVTAGPGDVIAVDGKALPRPEPARLWRYHKPKGLVTTTKDEAGRPTVFDRLPPELPRVLTVGRLDMTTEGLLLLTNDGGLKRHLELPGTGWLRRYRVRAYGRVTQAMLDPLKDGPVIDGIHYGPVIARVEREQGDNVWLGVDLREGKNREIKRVLESLGLQVNRLIRISYGPFTLEGLERGEVREVPRRILNEQLPERFRLKAGGRGAVSARTVKAAPDEPPADAARKGRRKPPPKRGQKPPPGTGAADPAGRKPAPKRAGAGRPTSTRRSSSEGRAASRQPSARSKRKGAGQSNITERSANEDRAIGPSTEKPQHGRSKAGSRSGGDAPSGRRPGPDGGRPGSRGPGPRGPGPRNKGGRNADRRR